MAVFYKTVYKDYQPRDGGNGDDNNHVKEDNYRFKDNDGDNDHDDDDDEDEDDDDANKKK